MIIGYADIKDKIASEFVQQEIGGTLVQVPTIIDDPTGALGLQFLNNLNQDLVLIGAQEVNSVYNQLVLKGNFIKVTPNQFAQVDVTNFNGHNIWGYSGWTKEGTVFAVEHLYLTYATEGLPGGGMSIATQPVLNELKYFEFLLSEESKKHIAQITPEQFKQEIEAQLQDPTFSGWHIEAVAIGSDNVGVLCRADGSIGWALVGALVGVAVAVTLSFLFPPLGIGIGTYLISGIVGFGAVAVYDWVNGNSDIVKMWNEAVGENNPDAMDKILKYAEDNKIDLTSGGGQPISEEIKDIVLWVGAGILIIGGTIFIFKSGLFGEGTRRVKERIERSRSKPKPKEIKAKKTIK